MASRSWHLGSQHAEAGKGAASYPVAMLAPARQMRGSAPSAGRVQGILLPSLCQSVLGPSASWTSLSTNSARQDMHSPVTYGGHTGPGPESRDKQGRGLHGGWSRGGGSHLKNVHTSLLVGTKTTALQVCSPSCAPLTGTQSPPCSLLGGSSHNSDPRSLLGTADSGNGVQKGRSSPWPQWKRDLPWT